MSRGVAREAPSPRPPRRGWEATRAAVLVLHGARCAGCGRDLLALNTRLRFLRATVPDEASALLEAEGLPKNRQDAYEVDHRVEISDGGSNDLDNLVPLCGPCHRVKTNGYMRALRGRRRRRRR